MPRYVKCQECGNTELYTERLEKMEIVSKTSETTNKTRNFYYHKGKCWDKHNKNQNFIVDELGKRDELDIVIKKIYNIKYQVPPRIWQMIQDLRNGTNRFQKFFKKRYKEGVPYDVIAEAYRMSGDSIKWAKLNRRFRDKEEEMRYGLKIVQSKIEDAYNKLKNSENTKKFSEAKEKVNLDLEFNDNRKVDYNKKKESVEDLSSIFGDD